MNTREYLNQIQRYDKMIHNKEEDLKHYESLATSIKSFGYGTERVQTSGSTDRMGDLVAKIVDLKAEILEDISSYVEKRAEVTRTIGLVKNPVLYDILFKRYIKGQSLGNIADEIGYSYIRTKELHLVAIETVKDIKGFDS